MKHRFNIKAEGGSSRAEVSILIETDAGYTRDEAQRSARDILDEIITGLGKRFRPSRIRLR